MKEVIKEEESGLEGVSSGVAKQKMESKRGKIEVFGWKSWSRVRKTGWKNMLSIS